MKQLSNMDASQACFDQVPFQLSQNLEKPSQHSRSSFFFIVCPQSGIGSSHDMFSLLQLYSSNRSSESACARPADTAAASQLPGWASWNLGNFCSHCDFDQIHTLVLKKCKPHPWLFLDDKIPGNSRLNPICVDAYALWRWRKSINVDGFLAAILHQPSFWWLNFPFLNC